jgi:hypothetical protein
VDCTELKFPSSQPCSNHRSSKDKQQAKVGPVGSAVRLEIMLGISTVRRVADQLLDYYLRTYQLICSIKSKIRLLKLDTIVFRLWRYLYCRLCKRSLIE